MSRVVEVSREEREERPAALLVRVGLSFEELTERAETAL
jgi:hypothetical protein